MTVAIERYLKWLALGAIFAVPFVVLVTGSWAFFPYIVPKALTFRILVEVAFGSWLILLFLGAVPRPQVTPIRVAIGIFVAIVAIADFHGVAPFKSFWSNFERMEGLVTLLHAFAYFIVAGSILNTHKLWERFWQVSLGVSVVVGLGALSELGDGVTRIAGSTGNPIYLAVYALFHTFVAGLLMRKDPKHRWVYAALALLNVTVLWFTGTRGALLGLIAGILVTALGIVLFAHKSAGRWLYRAASGALIAVALLGASFFLLRDNAVVQDNYMLSRLANITLSTSETARDTSSLRLMVWGSALQGVKEHPILGWGQENFNYVFNTYYNPHMYWAEPWYDRTHNIMLDWLIAAGVLGLLGYLAMYLVVFIEAMRTDYFDRVEVSILAGLLAAYGVHNLFVFDHLVSYILFFSLAAWIHGVRIGGETPGPVGTSNYMGRALGITAITAGTLIVLYLVNWPAFQENRLLLQAMVAAQNPTTISESRELFDRAISYHTVGTQEAREQFSLAASRLAEAANVPIEEKQSFVNDALKEMQAHEREYPEDARFPYFTASLLSAYGADAEAEPFFMRALELNQNKPQFLVNVAVNAMRRGDFTTAEEYLMQAQALDATYEEPGNLLEQLSVLKLKAAAR